MVEMVIYYDVVFLIFDLMFLIGMEVYNIDLSVDFD